MYERVVKRLLDIVLSAAALICLSWLFLLIAAAIYIDDPGPVLFAQKRVGKDKKLFRLYKFRSMKMSTPHDIPTHLLENPEQYITRVGRFLRKSSLDELPQIWNIFAGTMSVIGPRPPFGTRTIWWRSGIIRRQCRAPGLTGWAQINGRDELEIPVKAGLDGVYIKNLKAGGLPAFAFDCRCFLGTIFSVARGGRRGGGRHGRAA
jgi:O-antigen biosynthesis protein WbqP